MLLKRWKKAKQMQTHEEILFSKNKWYIFAILFLLLRLLHLFSSSSYYYYLHIALFSILFFVNQDIFLLKSRSTNGNEKYIRNKK